MKNFVANIKLVLQDSFSSGLNAARTSVKGIGESLQGLQANTGLLQTASSLGLMAASTEQYRQKLVASLAEPSRKAGELEQSLAAATTVMNAGNTIDGSVAKTYDLLREQALAWASGHAEGSRIASVSASEYASTTYSMLSAGLKADAAIAATNRSLILAKGTMGDNKTAADLLAISYNTMGDKTADIDSEMSRLADTIANTQATFQIANLGQLNEGLKYGIPVAQKYGIAWTELNTIIGQLNTSGLSGSLAGTSLSSMMAQMNKASGKLGFNIAYNEQGGTDVIATLENIQKKFGDVTKLAPNVQMAFDEAFGTEGGRALTLLSASLESLKANYGQIGASDGQSTMMAERMSDSFVEQAKRMENARSALQSQLGESTNKIQGQLMGVQTAWYNMAGAMLSTPIGEKLSTLVSGGTLATSALLKVGGTALNTTAQIATIAAMGGKAGGMLNLLKSSATLLASPLIGLGHGLAKIGGGIMAALPAMGAWITSMFSAAAAHWAVIAPVALIVAGVIALGVAIFMIVKHWDSIKAAAVGAWEGIKTAWGAAGQWLGGVWDSVTAGVMGAWQGVKQWFAGLWDSITGGAVAAFDWIVGKITAVATAIKQPFTWIKDKIGGLFGGDDSQQAPLEAPQVAASPIGQAPALAGEPKKGVGTWIKDKVGGLFGRNEGKAAMDAMAAGIEGQAPVLADTTASAFGQTSAFIPHSDAKRGPFSTLTASGRAIPATLAKGLSQGGALLTRASENLFARVQVASPAANVLQFPTPEQEGSREASAPQGQGGLLSALVDRLSKREQKIEKHYHTEIKQITLPDVKDIQDVIRFVSSLEQQFELDSTEEVAI